MSGSIHKLFSFCDYCNTKFVNFRAKCYKISVKCCDKSCIAQFIISLCGFFIMECGVVVLPDCGVESVWKGGRTGGMERYGNYISRMGMRR